MTASTSSVVELITSAICTYQLSCFTSWSATDHPGSFFELVARMLCKGDGTLLNLSRPLHTRIAKTICQAGYSSTRSLGIGTSGIERDLKLLDVLFKDGKRVGQRGDAVAAQLCMSEADRGLNVHLPACPHPQTSEPLIAGLGRIPPEQPECSASLSSSRPRANADHLRIRSHWSYCFPVLQISALRKVSVV